MKIVLDRQKKITLLQWLKRGYMDTTDIELMSGGRLEIVNRQTGRGIPVGCWIEYETGERLPRPTDEDIAEVIELGDNDIAEVVRLYNERHRSGNPNDNK